MITRNQKYIIYRVTVYCKGWRGTYARKCRFMKLVLLHIKRYLIVLMDVRRPWYCNLVTFYDLDYLNLLFCYGVELWVLAYSSSTAFELEDRVLSGRELAKEGGLSMFYLWKEVDLDQCFFCFVRRNCNKILYWNLEIYELRLVLVSNVWDILWFWPVERASYLVVAISDFFHLQRRLKFSFVLALKLN